MQSLTPNNVDPFSRYMADLFDENKVIGVSTGFQTFFGDQASGGSQTVFETDKNAVDIDIVRGNERTAKMILRGSDAREIGTVQKNTRAEQSTNITRKFPLIEEAGDIEADQLLYRQAGENPYAIKTRLDRMRALALKHHMGHIRRIVRTFEILASSSILLGQHGALLGTTNTNYIYDFLRAAGNTITTLNPWNGGSQDIMGDIDAGCNQMRIQGKTEPNMAVLGGKVMDAFIRDTTTQNLADNRRYEMIQVSRDFPVPAELSKFILAGFKARGRLVTPEGYTLWLFTYNDGYTNDAGTFVPYMPIDKMLIANSKARCDRYFGPAEALPQVQQRIDLYADLFGFDLNMPPMPPNIKSPAGVLNPAMFYSDAYVSSDWKRLTMRTQSAPIFTTTQTDAFVTLDGLIT